MADVTTAPTPVAPAAAPTPAPAAVPGSTAPTTTALPANTVQQPAQPPVNSAPIVQAQIAPFENAANTATAKATQLASQGNQPQPPQKHARLMAMIQGLSLGLGSFGSAIATHGREGGVEEVQQVEQARQQQQLEQQKAATEQLNQRIQQQIQIGDTNRQTAQNIILLSTLPTDLSLKDLSLTNAQTQAAAGRVGLAKDTYEFQQESGMSPDSFTAMMSGNQKGFTPDQQASYKGFNQQKLTAYSKILPSDNPYLQQAQTVLADKNSTPMQWANAVAAVTREIGLNQQVNSAQERQNQIKAGQRPKNLEDATAMYVQTKQEYDSNPTPENKKAMDDAYAQKSAAYADRLNQLTAQAKVGAEATGKGTEGMYKNGVDPITGQRLTLTNAPDAFLIDTRTGNPIPTAMLTVLKPTMQESNRADFAASAMHSLDQLDQLRASGKLPNGPLTGLTTKALAKAGLSSADAQKAIDFISFAQSAATGAHVGGRFNEDILKKMADMIKLNMNSDQLQGAEDAIRTVMSQYVQQGGRYTVAEWNNMTPEQRKVALGQASGSASQAPSVSNPSAIPGLTIH